MGEAKIRHKLNIVELIDAFEMGSLEHQNYLDLETGAILFGTSPAVELELRQVQDELGSEETLTYEKMVEYIEQAEMQHWLKSEVLQAVEIQDGVGTRFIAIPWTESRDGYRDMELFIDIVEDGHCYLLPLIGEVHFADSRMCCLSIQKSANAGSCSEETGHGRG